MSVCNCQLSVTEGSSAYVTTKVPLFHLSQSPLPPPPLILIHFFPLFPSNLSISHLAFSSSPLTPLHTRHSHYCSVLSPMTLSDCLAFSFWHPDILLFSITLAPHTYSLPLLTFVLCSHFSFTFQPIQSHPHCLLVTLCQMFSIFFSGRAGLWIDRARSHI